IVTIATLAFLSVSNANAIGTTNTTLSNNTTTLGNPLYVEHQQIIRRNDVNATGDIQIFWRGHGMIRGMNTTDSGQMLITYGLPGVGLYMIPLFVRGQGALFLHNETIPYIFQSIGYTDNNQTSKLNGLILGIPSNTIGM